MVQAEVVYQVRIADVQPVTQILAGTVRLMGAIDEAGDEVPESVREAADHLQAQAQEWGFEFR